MRCYLYTLALWGFAACSSKQTQQNKTFDELLSRADELRRAGSTDTDAYQRLVFDLETLGSQNPEFCADAQQKEKATATLAQYPALACGLRVSEPNEKFYAATGFASPLRLVAECPAVAPFRFDADSQAMALSGEGMRFVNGYLNAELRITSASQDASRNTLLFNARYYAQDFLDHLAALCRIDPTPGIKLSPQAYRIQANPISDGGVTTTMRSAAFGSEEPLAKLRFRKGSMQLSSETRKALKNLKGVQKSLRITGYADDAKPKAAERLANLRARAVASYLEEYAGIDKVKLHWQAQAYKEQGIGVVIEELD